jgi:hypothetical protein
MARPLGVKALANKMAAMILGGSEVPELIRTNETRVRVMTTKVIPETNNQTTSGRRKRFILELQRLLAPHGWTKLAAGSHLVLQKPLQDPKDAGR